jgi:SPP1 gp7 family putative phage head morphogenesis protein
MSSFVSFSQFIRHGGQASIILSLFSAEPSLELKQSPLDPATVDAFEQRLRELAAENWSGIAAALLRAGIEADPAAEDIEAEIAQARAAYSEQASAILASGDPSVSEADLEALSDWSARRFLIQINERRQRQLGVTHFIWRTQDDEKVRAAHAERDDRVFSWQDGFPDGAPGHGYNCRCVAEPAIVDGTILLTDVPASPEISDRIAEAQASGLADEATDAAVGGAVSVYDLVRFSWLGYRRLFGMITPEEEAERLAMRQGVFRAIDALAALDEETLRQLADAFVDHFDARHADLRLLDLEYRLGLASEETLLRVYRDVAYMDGATTLGTTAFATFAARLGINMTRLRPRDAFVVLRAAGTDGNFASHTPHHRECVRCAAFCRTGSARSRTPASRRRGHSADVDRPGPRRQRPYDRDIGGWCYGPTAPPAADCHPDHNTRGICRRRKLPSADGRVPRSS